MAGEAVKLKRGTKANMPTVKEPGSILIATDTGEAYVDNSSTQRVQLKDTTKLPTSGGILTGDLDLGSHKVTSSHTPTAVNDLTNKKYVDNAVSAGVLKSNTNITVATETPTEINISKSTISSADDTSTITVNHKSTENKVITSTSKWIGHHKGLTGEDQSPNFGESFEVGSFAYDGYGHVIGGSTQRVTLPKAPTVTLTAGNKGVTVSGTKVSHATHTAQSGGPTKNVNVTHGGSFTVPQITSDEFGHVTAITNRNITLPSAPTSVATLSTTRLLDGMNFNGSADVVRYGVCDNERGAKTSTVHIEGFNLVNGAVIYVKFPKGVTVSDPYLNVSQTGAFPLKYEDETVNIQGLYTDMPNYNYYIPIIFIDNVYYIMGYKNKYIGDNSAIYVDDESSTIEHKSFLQSATTVGAANSFEAEFGEVLNVPYLTFNKTGHVSSVETHKIKLPQAKLTTAVADEAVQFRNIVVMPKGTPQVTIENLDVPVGTIICVEEYTPTIADGTEVSY